MSLHLGGRGLGHLVRVPFASAQALAVYDFAGGSYPAVSVSRASTGYVADLAGVYTSVAADTLRRSNRGALIEPAATNLVRNSAAQGAIAGSPGTWPTNWSTVLASGISSQIVGSGTENGLDYVDIRFFGTATASGNGVNVRFDSTIAANPNQAYAFSISHRVVAGSMPGSPLFYWNYAGAGGVSVSVPSPTDTLQRFSLTQTTPAGASSLGNSNYYAPVTGGTVMDVTIRFCLPQIEAGSVATSPIRTTGASATRAADAASITLPAGTGRITYTFDDGSTQQVGVSPGPYTIPTNLARPYIARATVLP